MVINYATRCNNCDFQFDSDRKANKLRLLRRDSSDKDFPATDHSLIELISLGNTMSEKNKISENLTPSGIEEEEKHPEQKVALRKVNSQDQSFGKTNIDLLAHSSKQLSGCK